MFFWEQYEDSILFFSAPDPLPEIPCFLQLKLAQMKDEMRNFEKTLLASSRTKVAEIAIPEKLYTEIKETRNPQNTSYV